MKRPIVGASICCLLTGCATDLERKSLGALLIDGGRAMNAQPLMCIVCSGGGVRITNDVKQVDGVLVAALPRDTNEVYLVLAAEELLWTRISAGALAGSGADVNLVTKPLRGMLQELPPADIGQMLLQACSEPGLEPVCEAVLAEIGRRGDRAFERKVEQVLRGGRHDFAALVVMGALVEAPPFLTGSLTVEAIEGKAGSEVIGLRVELQRQTRPAKLLHYSRSWAGPVMVIRSEEGTVVWSNRNREVPDLAGGHLMGEWQDIVAGKGLDIAIAALSGGLGAGNYSVEWMYSDRHELRTFESLDDVVVLRGAARLVVSDSGRVTLHGQ